MAITKEQIYQLCINDIQLITVLLEHRNLSEASTAMGIDKEDIINQIKSISHVLGEPRLFEFNTAGDVVFSLSYFNEKQAELRRFVNTTIGSLRKIKARAESDVWFYSI